MYNFLIPDLRRAPDPPAFHAQDFKDDALVATVHPAVAEVAWVLQVTPPLNRVKAENLVQTLYQQGYRAYLHALPNDSYAVRIGPETDKKRLQAWTLDLAKRKLTTQLISYDPLAST
jgi:cell division septation protein DedD